MLETHLARAHAPVCSTTSHSAHSTSHSPQTVMERRRVRWGCVFFSPSTLPRLPVRSLRRQVAKWSPVCLRHRQAVAVLQSCGVQFHAMLRMAATPVKNKIHITSHSAHWTSHSSKRPKRVRSHAPGKASSTRSVQIRVNLYAKSF